MAIKGKSPERDRLRFGILRGNGTTSTVVPPWRDVPVCVVVAHPDDETIGCGAQLSNNATVVVLACYTTQRHTLSGFAIETERFRPMPRHDFTVLPNGGRCSTSIMIGACEPALNGKSLPQRR